MVGAICPHLNFCCEEAFQFKEHKEFADDERGKRMMFNLGPSELVFLALIIVLLFGAKKVPELFASLGQGIREFKKAMREVDEDDKSG